MSKIASIQIENRTAQATGLRYLLVAALCGWLLLGLTSALPGSLVMPQEKAEHSEQENSEQEHGETGHSETAGHEAEHGHEGEAGHDDVSNFDYFLGSDHLIGHTQDKPYFEFPSFRDENGNLTLFGDIHNKNKKLYIPQLSPWSDEAPLMKEPGGNSASSLARSLFSRPSSSSCS